MTATKFRQIRAQLLNFSLKQFFLATFLMLLPSSIHLVSTAVIQRLSRSFFKIIILYITFSFPPLSRSLSRYGGYFCNFVVSSAKNRPFWDPVFAFPEIRRCPHSAVWKSLPDFQSKTHYKHLNCVQVTKVPFCRGKVYFLVFSHQISAVYRYLGG